MRDITRSTPALAKPLGSGASSRRRPDREASSARRPRPERPQARAEHGGRVRRWSSRPAVAEPRRAPERRRGLAADDERRVRLRDGLRLERHRLELEEGPVVGDGGLGPEPAADAERLVEPPAAGREVDARSAALAREPARATPPRAARQEARVRIARAAQRGRMPEVNVAPEAAGARMPASHAGRRSSRRRASSPGRVGVRAGKGEP